jgi:type IV pilus assembly protein PilA
MGSRRTCLVLIGAALFAGCGDDDDDSSSVTETTQQTAEQLDAAAKSDARNLVTGVEACFIDQQDYSLCEKPEGADAPTATVEAAGLTTYTVVAKSESGNEFRLEKGDDGTMTRACEEAGTGGCAADGSW